MKKIKVILVSIITTVLTLTSLFIVDTTAIEKSDYELSIDETEIQAALNKDKELEIREPYYFIENSVKEIYEKEKTDPEVSEYLLTPGLHEIIDNITLPYESNTIKKELLGFLEDKVLVRHYQGDEITMGNTTCQILVVANPDNDKVYVLGVNTSEEDYTCSLFVNHENGEITKLKGITINEKKVTQESDITTEQLSELQSDEIQTEIVSVNTNVPTQETKEEINEETISEAISESNNEIKETTYGVNVIEEKQSNMEQSNVSLTKKSFSTMEVTYDIPIKSSIDKSTIVYDQPALLHGDKKAVSVNGTENLFKVTLDITGQVGTGSRTEPAPADVIIVLDLSASMDQNKDNGVWRWYRAQDAINTISDTLMGPGANADVQMALVGYSSQESGSTAHSIYKVNNQEFTNNLSGFKNLYNAHPSASSMRKAGSIGASGTNCHAGMIGAKELLESRKNNNRNKFVVFISDGEPNRFYTNTTKGSYVEHPNGNANQYTLPVDVANELKKDGTNIYSVAISLPNAGNATKNMFNGIASSPDKVIKVSAEDDIKVKFGEIANSIRQIPISKPNGPVTLTDNLSEYVERVSNYNGETMQDQVSYDGGNTWHSYNKTDVQYKRENGIEILTWNIPDFDESNTYRITYFVRIKDQYLGEKYHKNNTYGDTPEPGTDGVIANGDTYLHSDEVLKERVKVPTVYADKPEIVQAASLTGNKQAQLLNQNLEAGKYRITIVFSGLNEITKIGETSTENSQKSVTLIDPMSEYVNYLGNITREVSVKQSGNWNEFNQGTLTTANNKITWTLPDGVFHDMLEYRISYDVQVKEAYAGQKWHEDQISGLNPPNASSDLAIGVLANGQTYLQSSLVNFEEIMVPA
ncbi:MAG: vWA domain-containing protein, partial [Coprobacillaceae bacterium]